MKLLVKILLVCLLLFLLSMTVGQKILLWCFSKLDYEWDISPQYQAFFYNPRCACDCPPFLIVDISHDEAVWKGKYIRVFQNKNDLSYAERSDSPYYVLKCDGRIKKSLYVWFWESSLEGSSCPVTGQFFDADHCVVVQPTARQGQYIDDMIYNSEE